MGPSLAAAQRGGLVTTPGHNAGKRPPNYGLTLKSEPLTRAEVKGLLAAFSRRGSAGIRNAAMTALMANCGPRLGEVVKAPLGDLDLEQRTFYIRFPKRDRFGRMYPRHVGLDVETTALLERWLDRRRKLGIGSKAPLFCQIQADRRGQPMHPSGYREALKTAAAAAAIGKRVHPHGLRHTFAFAWIDGGGRLDELMLALGHRNLATTHTYIAHLQPKQVLERMRQRDPDAVRVHAPDVMTELAALKARLDELLG
jgi:integrase